MDIPWEYIYLETGADLNGFLGIQEHFSLAHCLVPDISGSSLKSLNLPIKAAFLSTEADCQEFKNWFQDVNGDLIVNNRQNVIRLDKFSTTSDDNLALTLSSKEAAEESDLTRAFKGYEVVQLLSHAGAQFLSLGDDTVLAEELKDFFEMLKWRVQVVVLCACKSALNPRGAAVALHRAGVPLVIGMTRSIWPETARRFLEVFYSQLAAQACSVEEAVAVARNQLREYSTQGLRLDWGLPRLYLRSEHSHIIDLDQLYQPVFQNVIQTFETLRADILKKKVTAQSGQEQPPPWQQEIEDWINHDEELGILYLCGASGSVTDHPLVFSRDSLFPQLEASFSQEVFRNWLRSDVFPLTANKAREAFFDLVIAPLREAMGQSRALKPLVDTLSQDLTNLQRNVFEQPLRHSPPPGMWPNMPIFNSPLQFLGNKLWGSILESRTQSLRQELYQNGSHSPSWRPSMLRRTGSEASSQEIPAAQRG